MGLVGADQREVEARPPLSPHASGAWAVIRSDRLNGGPRFFPITGNAGNIGAFENALHLSPTSRLCCVTSGGWVPARNNRSRPLRPRVPLPLAGRGFEAKRILRVPRPRRPHATPRRS